MNAKGHHPPVPGPVVQPNFLSIEEALGDVTFPISKRDLIDQIRDGTAIYEGRNVDLAEIVRDLNDDFFESEEDLHAALESRFGPTAEGEEFAGTTPTGPQDTWQTRVGPGDSASKDTYIEPPE